VQQHDQDMVRYIIWAVKNLMYFPAVKEFWKLVWQSYCDGFGGTFLDTVYCCNINSISIKSAVYFIVQTVNSTHSGQGGAGAVVRRT